MPGYLTHIKTLIDADAWLGQIVSKLGPVSKKSPLENRIVFLATQVRDYFRFTYDPSIAGKGFPPIRPVDMGTEAGTGLSKYAMTGALGPDIPAAANIMGVNQRWVSDTMHKGSPRRAWQNAKSTSLVIDPYKDGIVADLVAMLNGNDNKLYDPQIGTGHTPVPPKSFVDELKKPYMALMLGHMSAVATHVVINPFLNQWAWTHTTATRQQFSVQIDAMLAKAYFNRKDLHSGASWSDYLHADFWPHNDITTDFISETYARSFQKVYDSSPNELMCALPSVATLIQKYPGLDQVISGFPELRKDLGSFSGEGDTIAYDALTKSLDVAPQPGGSLAKSGLENVKDLSKLLKNYQGLAPKPDRDFFADGIRNTRNWALDAGYDHGPIYMSLFMSGLVAFGALNPVAFINKSGMGQVFNVWNNTVSFDADADVNAHNQQNWVQNGIANWDIWFDFFDSSYGACALPMWLYNALLGGIKIPKWLPGIRPAAEYLGLTDGFFGQGSDANDPWYVNLYVFYNDLASPLVLFPFVLQQWAAKWYRLGANGWVKWIFLWVVNIGFDALEELWMANGSNLIWNPLTTFEVFNAKERGANGDALGLQIWIQRLWLTGAYALSAIMAFGIKSKLDNPRNTDPSLNAGYYFLGLVFPAVFIGYFIWGRSSFEAEMVRKFAQVDWPSTDHSLVDEFIGSDVAIQTPHLTDDVGTPSKVALFSVEQMKQTPDNKWYFPDAEDQDKEDAFRKLDWENRRAADEDVRKDKNNHCESDQQYRLKQLLDRASLFAGTLCMALVNFDTADVSQKDAAAAIFQDWNLEYLTVEQWNDLMETNTKGKPGLIKSIETWWKNLNQQPAQPTSADMMERIATAFGMTATDAVRPS